MTDHLMDRETDEQEAEDTELYDVADADAGERIDRYLAERAADLSRSQIQNLIENGSVRVHNKQVKSNYKLRPGDRIEVTLPEPEATEVEPENIPLDIVFEDSDVIVVNKPRGMVVHPAAGHMRGTLVNALLYHCKDLSGINGVLRPGIVHRIDKDTSGLIMAAKNDRAHQSLAAQLKAHSVTRKYIAIVHGVVSHDVGTIDAPIGRHPVHRLKMAVVRNGGRHAVTHFAVMERFKEYTLLECKLETGRTHQIRVHMEFINHPLAGDPVYGPKRTLDIDGQALHAKILGFNHPQSGEYMEFDSEIPDDMARLIEQLRHL
ncbi:RluA family pseudouridine synthase [Effusibacillus dendaii]|uniref:Pseudouridine synthase n=1 Tax=Effusibacillus dendaii TaxID=2743772 RepID=A0A7I8D7K9_9BACL|nr:RluA family pseudouridine synthase [Effusibacillus dendaii]BCJ86045.1 putative RNA pseudouridine synthase YlyB [Effusibacillus dendaii]